MSVDNPNVYDDAGYATATNKLNSAIGALWEAGATVQNLEDEISNAVENAVGQALLVSVEGLTR